MRRHDDPNEGIGCEDLLSREPAARQVLTAIGFLAPASLPKTLLEAALDRETFVAGTAILLRERILRESEESSRLWTVDADAYRYAQDLAQRKRGDLQLQENLAAALQDGLDPCDRVRARLLLEHVEALLAWDGQGLLWYPLVVCLLDENQPLSRYGWLDEIGRLLAVVRGYFEQLAPEIAGTPEWQRHLGLLLNREGDLARANGKDEAAAELYRRALYSARQNLEIEPASSFLLADLRAALDRIGSLAFASGDLKSAETAYRESLGVVRILIEGHPEKFVERLLQDLGHASERLGDVLNQRGSSEEAFACYEEAIALARLLKETSGRRRLPSPGGFDLALDAYRDLLASCTRQAAEDLAKDSAPSDLLALHDRIAEILDLQGNPDDAADQYRQALSLCRRLAAKDGSNLSRQRDLASGLEKLGGALRLEPFLEPLYLCREETKIRQRIAAADPSNASDQENLSAVLYRLAILEDGFQPGPRALRLAKNSLAIAEALALSAPEKSSWQEVVAARRQLVERLRREQALRQRRVPAE